MLLFIDSFDHYSKAQMSRKWNFVSTPGGGDNLVAARTGLGWKANAGKFPFKTLPGTYVTLTAGVAYNTPAFANAILRFENMVFPMELELLHVGDGRLRFKFGLQIPALAPIAYSDPSTFAMHLNKWYYVEMQAHIEGGETGLSLDAWARVNGGEILSWHHGRTTEMPTLEWASVGLEGPGGGNLATVDDFYCTSDEWLGDVRIGVLYPNAAGDVTDWVPNAAGANYTKVNEHPADDDTTYVETAVIDARDLYQLDDIDPSFTGGIKGVQALWLVRKSDGGDASVKGLWGSGTGGTVTLQNHGNNYSDPGGFYPSTDYTYNIQAERTNIWTDFDWTSGEINALQLGITRTEPV